MILPIFPEIVLSDSELNIIGTQLDHPVVKKYFHKLAYDLARDLIVNGEPAEGETAESFLRRQAAVRGRLEAFNTLLLVEKAK